MDCLAHGERPGSGTQNRGNRSPMGLPPELAGTSDNEASGPATAPSRYLQGSRRVVPDKVWGGEHTLPHSNKQCFT